MNADPFGQATARWQIDLPEATAVIDISFAPTRTQYLSVEVHGITAGFDEERAIWVAELPGALEQSTTVDLVVTYRAEPPSLVTHATHDVTLQTTTEGTEPVRSPRLRALTSQEAFAKRTEKVKAMPKADRAAHGMWLRVDRETSPELFDPGSERAAQLKLLSEQVMHRTWARTLAASNDRLFAAPTTPARGRREFETAAETVSGAMVAAYRENQSLWVDNAFDWAQFAAEFERFAAHERLIDLGDSCRGGHGGPNGFRMFVGFAEAALLFIDLAVDREFWMPALSSMVRCSEIVRDLQWTGVRRTESSYTLEHYLRTRKTYPLSARRTLAARYHGATTEELEITFGCILWHAMADSVACHTPHGPGPSKVGPYRPSRFRW